MLLYSDLEEFFMFYYSSRGKRNEKTRGKGEREEGESTYQNNQIIHLILILFESSSPIQKLAQEQRREKPAHKIYPFLCIILFQTIHLYINIYC